MATKPTLSSPTKAEIDATYGDYYRFCQIRQEVAAALQLFASRPPRADEIKDPRICG